MRTKFGILVALFSLLGSGAGLLAHHSFTTEYDGSKTFNIKGTVSKVEWTNPHARFYVDTTDESGKMVTWNMELASPSALARNGWTSRTLKVGDQVTVTPGSTALLVSVTRPLSSAVDNCADATAAVRRSISAPKYTSRIFII